jgi:phage anti-repressor protein
MSISRNLKQTKELKMSEISPALVFSMLNSDKEFPVSLDDAWQWLGYSRKEHAKNCLSSNFEQDSDYIIEATAKTGDVTVSGFQPNNRQDIYLTVDCFKSFAMLAGTAKGKEVRKYFLNCEKRLKELLKVQTTQANLLKAETRKRHKTSYSSRKRVLKEHGVQPISQGHITRQDYKILLDKDTKELRQNLGLSKTDLIVDHLETSDQATLSFAHVMQMESLEIKNIHGYYPVKNECGEIMKNVVDFRNNLRDRANNIIQSQKEDSSFLGS